MQVSSPDLTYKQRLEEIAEKHLSPDPGQNVDVLLRAHIRDRIMSWVAGPEILEMGAGEVMWTGDIVGRFGHSSIVDGSRKLLDNATATFGDRVTCYESFFEDFTPPRRFQTVVATHVLEHVHDPVRVLKQAHHWLAPGGRILVVVPNATSLHRRIGVLMGALKSVYDFSDRDLVIGHQRVYDLPRLRDDALQAGFRIVHTWGFFLKMLPVASMTGFSPALIRALFDVADELPAEMAADIGLVLESDEP